MRLLESFFRANSSSPDIFYVTLSGMTNGSIFTLQMSAIGNFQIDWGDNSISNITKLDTTFTTYSHTYSSAGSFIVKIQGKALGYHISGNIPAITFLSSTNKLKITTINGKLSGIFPTISGINPSFYYTFSGLTNMFCQIPNRLFSGLTGNYKEYMFNGTFNGCTGLTGAIPSGLFGNLSGSPAYGMFQGTFNGCTGLTGAIPSGLFGNLSGSPIDVMFFSTFVNCTGLTGAIPSGLFGNLSGSPAYGMFAHTFNGCSGLEKITDCFVNCTFTVGTASLSILRTFYNCTSAHFASPADSNNIKFYNWDNTASDLDTYTNDSHLSDILAIPNNRK